MSCSNTNDDDNDESWQFVNLYNGTVCLSISNCGCTEAERNQREFITTTLSHKLCYILI